MTKDRSQIRKNRPPKTKYSPAVEYHHHIYPVKIVFAPNKKAWKDATNGIDPNDPSPAYPDTSGRMSVYSYNGGMLYIITIGDDAETHNATTVMGIMVHECMHVVQYLEKFIGGRLDDESQAYLMQNLVMWLSDQYTKAGRKHAK